MWASSLRRADSNGSSTAAHAPATQQPPARSMSRAASWLYSNTPLLIGGDGSSSTLGSRHSQSKRELAGHGTVVHRTRGPTRAYGTLTILQSGTLQAGGADGIRQKGRGTAAFNLGGGTIQVIGSDLTTSVDMSLQPSTNSTIDTNGFNATVSSNISGDGGLTKTGAADPASISPEAAGYTGPTTVDEGTLFVDGSIDHSAVAVNNGGILGGNGSSGAVTVHSGGMLSPEAQPRQFQRAKPERGSRWHLPGGNPRIRRGAGRRHEL